MNYLLLFFMLLSSFQNEDYYRTVLSKEYNGILSVKLLMEGKEKQIIIARNDLNGLLYKSIQIKNDAGMYNYMYENLKRGEAFNVKKRYMRKGMYYNIVKSSYIDSIYNNNVQSLINKFFKNGVLTGSIDSLENPYILKILFDNKVLMILDDMTGSVVLPDYHKE